MTQREDTAVALSEAVKAIKAIAEGYPITAVWGDRWIRVENPDFEEGNGSNPGLVIDAWSFATLSQLVPGVAVKPLEWETLMPDQVWCALTDVGEYRVSWDWPGEFSIRLKGHPLVVAGKPNTKEDALAVVQADYTTRAALLAPAAQASPDMVLVADEKLGRFGWHPDPAIDFELEVGDIEAEIYHHKVGFVSGTPPLAELVTRIERAMTFRVGAVETCVLAKHRLRELEKEGAALTTQVPSAGGGQ